METREELTESLEDYLEAIYGIILRKNAVRVKEIATELKVRYPSVTSALKALEKRGLINYEPYGTITLTKTGHETAIQITEKHRLLKSFFSTVLGVDNETADETACRIEHVISREVYIRLVRFVKFMYLSHESTETWLRDFRRFVKTDTPEIVGPHCMEDYFDGTGFELEGEHHEAGNA